MTRWNSSCLRIDLYLCTRAHARARAHTHTHTHTHTHDRVLYRLHLVRTASRSNVCFAVPKSTLMAKRIERTLTRDQAFHYSSLYNNFVKWRNCEKPP